MEGHQLLTSNPRYGGSTQQYKVGVYSFPCANNPATHTTDSVAEETFGDGIWATAEIVFYIRSPQSPGETQICSSANHRRWH
eukprot:559256-Pyramimonas_sp.AAC.1